MPEATVIPLLLAAAFFDWLLGLQELSTADRGLELAWRYALPAWAWLLIALAAGLFAAWSYHRLMGSPWARTGLATARTALILFVAILLAGPVLVLPQEQIEPDWLLCLVDRSASLNIRDVQEGDVVRSRDESLRDALAQQAEVFRDDRLGQDRRLLWLGFDAKAYDIAPPATAGLPEPDGNATALRTAIGQALDRASGRPVSGVVLFTDGRSPQSTTADLVRRLQQQAVGVFSVPLGAQTTPLDFAVGRVDAPDRAFVNDTVPVRIWLEQYPADAGVDPDRLRVRLIDQRTNQTLETAQPTRRQLQDGEPMLLTARSEAAGPATWRIELEHRPAPNDNRRELVLDNNTREIPIEFVDRPIRVLYVEGYPRWEYRYLKNMLVREQSIQSSVMLISADPNFAQEGDLPLGRLPHDAEELKPFDVIIVGDVPASHFSSGQLELIRDHVAIRGCGLLWLGGTYHTPTSYQGTALADLLPMRRPSSVGRLSTQGGSVPLKPTPLAEALNVLRLTPPAHEIAAGDANASQFWPNDLPALQWVQDIGSLKPTSEVLAATPGPPDTTVPLVARLRYGAGQSIYVATDETWRWRYGRGGLYFEQFWTQLVQMLGRARVQRQTGGAWIELSHRRVGLDQPVVVEVHVDDPLLLQRELRRIEIEMVRTDDPDQTVLDRLQLVPVESSSPPQDKPAAIVEPEVFRAVWRPGIADALTLRVVEPALADRNLELGIDVVRPDDELRQPATDHARLANLAEQTGGAVIALNELNRLEELVPNRARRTPLDVRESLWDSPLALLLALMLITIEWVGRKATRLV